MAMENPFEGKEIWFGVGSQDLYGEEALRQVAQQTGEMVDFLNATGKIPAKIVLKPTLKSSDGVKAFMTEASANPNVIGVITWCHTFSPGKMWINGFAALQKPYCHFATQYNREIPNEEIDMDFMNLNQAAHGDREHGFTAARLRVLAGRGGAETPGGLDARRRGRGGFQRAEGHALRRQYAGSRRDRGR